MLARTVLLVLCLATPARAEPVSGRATALDGETIEIGGKRIRLTGIDAPEKDQTCHDGKGDDYPCGRTSLDALSEKVGSEIVSCDPVGEDPEAGTLARCRLGETDLGQWMVERGHAMAYRKYSTAYVDAEDDARRRRSGLWVGTFVPPWNWRKGERQ